MSQLLAIIDEYKDAHGAPSDSSIARAIGVAPQTVSSWRRRGIRQLPERETLMALARLTNRDYATVVIPAVMRDIGYLAEESDGNDEDRAASMNVTELSAPESMVAGDELRGLPNVAHKRSRTTKGRDEG
jgi:transposase-like protein